MNKRKPNNKDDYIVINKRELEDNVFLMIFIIFVLLMSILMIKGFINMRAELIKESLDINPDKIASYRDDNLNILYSIPGDTWVIAQLEEIQDNSDEENELSVKNIIENSKGDDGIFDIETDLLSGEILSSIYFNQQGIEGFKQFMSYTFKPDMGYSEDKFVEYCQASFERDVTILNGDSTNIDILEKSDDVQFTLLDTVEYDRDSIMLKCYVTTKILKEEENSNETEEVKYEDFDLYYTQFIKRIGTNLLTITFGSINEDSSVDTYLKYFANSVINLNTMQ